MALLVLLPRAAPAGLVAAGLLLHANRLGLLVVPLAVGTVPVAVAAAARHGELADLILVGLPGLPAAREPRLVLRHLAHAEHQRRDVLVDRLHHRAEELGRVAQIGRAHV